MTAFLCFRLHGPLASWGEVAVGDRRPSAPAPTRSGIVGLIAGALGVDREEEELLVALDHALGVATLVQAPGQVLVDYHSAQAPEAKQLSVRSLRGRPRPGTRKAALGFDPNALGTLLTLRQYRMDMVTAACVWERTSLPRGLTLDQLSGALRRPRFIPYLGRRSCPPSLPFEPRLIEAANPVAALASARFESDGWLAPLLQDEAEPVARWEGDWSGLVPAQSVVRRDKVISRSRWQFVERTEHQRPVKPEEVAACT